MLLADTSVWIAHFKKHDPILSAALHSGEIILHPMIIMELALGSLSKRSEVLSLLKNMPLVPLVTEAELLHMVEKRKLYSRGIGYVDAHLLASALLSADVSLWTYDKKLATLAEELNVLANPKL